MDDPASHLPPPHSPATILALAASLGLPAPTSSEPLTVTAAFHRIYLLHFPASAALALAPAKPDEDGTVTLVLCVSGDHLPRIKTENEIAMMRWRACPGGRAVG
ncbi:hypothetical protein COL922a_005518 [Colletotrichum nupharicola]|nr:hypothetical protein COL922a_005518 [Colletotrichum nupharicola]